MKKVTYGLIPILLLWVCSTTFAQTKPPKDTLKTVSVYSVSEQYKKYLPNYSPLSPNAAGMQRMGDYQVNLATGIPDISIPIYTVTDGSISQPIILRYHAGGHTLKELASWVGWGWSLDYGGSVNRSLQGLPDDKDGTFGSNYLNNPILTTDSPDLCNNSTNYDFANKIRTNSGDAQPDIFSYSTNSKSGKFTIGQGTDSPYLIPFQPIKINRTLNSSGYLQKFDLIDDNGTSYVFGVDSAGNSAVETQVVTNGQWSNGYISTWNLTHIKSPNSDDQIKFFYQNGGSLGQEDIQWSVSILSNVTSTDGQYENTTSAIAKDTPVGTTTTQNNIQRISFTNGEVEFVQNGVGETRTDQTGSKYLKKINIYNFENGIKKLQKVVEFTYSYFKDADNNDKRLKLDKVRFRDTTNTIQLDHTFEYHTNNYSWTDNTDYLKKQDYFGFYNGFANQSLIGLSSYNVGSTMSPNLITISNGGANRSTVATYMKQGILKKVTYPTGGFTTFDYETNQYQYEGIPYLAGGLRVKEIKSYPSNAAQAITKRYVYGTADSTGIGKIPTNWFPQSANIATKQTLNYSNATPAGSTANGIQHIITPYGQLELGSFDASPVCYTWVKEYFEDDTAAVKNGRNEYSFNYYRDMIANLAEYSIKDIRFWKRGQLLEKKTYDSNNILVSKTTNSYADFKTALKTVAGVVNTSNVYEGNAWSHCTTGLIPLGSNTPDMIYYSYDYPTGQSKLVSSTNLLDSVSITQKFTYDTNLIVDTTTTENSYTNSFHQFISIFPSHKSYNADAIAIEMRNRNMLDITLESIERDSINGSIVPLFKQKTVYAAFTTSYNARGLGSNILPSSVWIAPTGGTLEKRISYHNYDDYGNPKEYSVDSLHTALIWGYKNSQVLGVISNATTAQIAAKLTSASITENDFSVTTLSNTQLTKLETFRNSLPKSTHVSWFTYRPNVGLSSSISPNGLKTKFIYDALQRLLFTKDHADYITGKYTYEYGSPYNKVTSIVPRIAITNENTVFFSNNAIINYQFFDGLGRPLQIIGDSQTPDFKGVVLGDSKYDKYGRLTRRVLSSPTLSNSINFESNALAKAKTFYGDNAPLDSMVYESSPLNRNKKTFDVGNAWRVAQKSTQIFYENAGINVPYYTINSTGDITRNGTFPAKSLFKKRIIDEQGNTSIEVTDKQGRLIQKQVEQSTGEFLTTYFIYDGLGRELAVIQPEGYALNTSISSGTTAWNNFVFFYKYDLRGRTIESHIPNGGTNYTVFDKQDRQVLSQDEYQRPDKKWLFMKYDSLSRNIISGELTLTNTDTRSSLQSQFDAQAIRNEGFNASKPEQRYYTDVSFPFAVDSSKAMMVNYYDNYTTWRPSSYSQYNITPYSDAKGLLTGNLRRNTENRIMQLDAYYYDYRNRLLQAKKRSQSLGTNYEDFNYNFSGQATYNFRHYSGYSSNGTDQIQKDYGYDQIGRKTLYSHRILFYSTIQTSYAYDDISRLKTKKIRPNQNYEIKDTGADYINRPPALEQTNTQDIANKAITIYPGFVADSTTESYLAQIDTLGNSGTVDALQTIDYEYNIRGGLNCINCKNKQVRLGNKQNDLFSMKLDYNEDKRYFDGNISKQTWKNPLIPNAQQYKYSYDASSRLKKAQYLGGNTGDNYSIDTLNYDRNGNIFNLKRNGKLSTPATGLIDNLSYVYDGNKLLSVTDASNTEGFKDGNTSGNDYEYWNDGSLRRDKNKGIDSIFYHSYLRKVSRVKFSNGNWINFYYDGAGTLLKRKTHLVSPSQDDVWIYTDDLITKNGQIYQLNHDEGRATYDYTNSKWIYEYDYRDNQGNLRLSFRDSLVVGKPPVITQIDDRDPTGVSLAGLNYSGINKNNFGFVDRETIAETGWIDLNNRFFDPFILRFHQVDKLIEVGQHSFTPYHYSFNNPIRFSDPDGNFSYSDGYSTMDSRNATGSVSYSGSYNSLISNVSGDPPSWIQKLFNFFGFLKQPETQEEAQTYADRQGQLRDLNENIDQANKRVLEKTEYIPLIGSAAKLSDAMMKKDATGVVSGSIFFALDATGGGGVEKLTNGGKKVLGNLANMVETTLTDGVLQRGGKLGNLSVIDESLKRLKIGEIANMAAAGNEKAKTAIKILKQASSKAQKY